MHHSPATKQSTLGNCRCCLAYSISRMKALPAASPEPILRNTNKVATSPEVSLETQARWPLGEIISTGFFLSFMGKRKKLPFEVAFICQKVAPPDGTNWSYMFITRMSKGIKPDSSKTLRYVGFDLQIPLLTMTAEIRFSLLDFFPMLMLLLWFSSRRTIGRPQVCICGTPHGLRGKVSPAQGLVAVCSP